MGLPLAGANTVAVQIFPIADLALVAHLASANSPKGSTVFHTGCPATIVVLSKLTSGSGTLKCKSAATVAGCTYGSPDVSLSCSGTSLQACTWNSGSDQTALPLTATYLYSGVEQSTAGDVVFADLVILVLYRVPKGKEWGSVKHSISLAGAADDFTNTDFADQATGSGIISLAIA